MKATVGDLESALTDMAAQLENAQLDRDDMKDLHESLTGHSWVDEKTVKCCAKCNRDFTLKRRKVCSFFTLLSFYKSSSIIAGTAEMSTVARARRIPCHLRQIQSPFEFATIATSCFSLV